MSNRWFFFLTIWINLNTICFAQNQNIRFDHIGTADGLSHSKITSIFQDSRGFMWFGTRDGNDHSPIVLTDFQLFNTSVPVADSLNPESPLKKHIGETKEITLPYLYTVISFEFASLNYAMREGKRYSYILEGFDQDWNTEHTKRTATYTNLNPGEYILKVKGLDTEGNWSNESINFKLTITPPYWKTWWFRILFTLAVAGVVVLIVIARINIGRQLKKNLEEQVRKSTAEITGQKEILEAQAENMTSLNEQLQQQTEFLQQINAELQLEREEADKARKEAEKANQEKSIFLATMSHEIRTPMNGVLGMASLLAGTSLTAEQKEYADTIHSSGEALLTVINDILDFSKIESGNLELDNYTFDLRQCIEDVMDIFASRAAQKGLDLIYQIDYQIPARIISDAHRLRQILLNLIGNAMKFTDHGEIFIGIDLAKIERDQLELTFQVRDTGIGIPHDKISRLFKAFSQVDSSTTRKYGGTGLGLVISQRMIELMGGSIAVESQPGVGTSFNFTIKSLISHEQAQQYANTDLKDNEGKRVLVVDDNKTNLTILRNQLEQWKLKPILASSGSEAMQILLTHEKFDLVITDMQMPEMDGVQLAKLIKAAHAALPVILLSSIGDESKKKHPELFSAVLNKPVKQLQFNRILQAVLRSDGIASPVEDLKQKHLSLSENFAMQYPLRILVAEDNPVNQKLIVHVLNKLGYQDIEIAHNGLAAVEKFDEQFYQVILMDVQMPEMDGMEATRMIRLKRYHQPVIIAMTANAMQGDREACIKAGMDDYISKPVKMEILLTLLEKWAIHIRQKDLEAENDLDTPPGRLGQG